MGVEVRPVEGEEELKALGEILRYAFHIPTERMGAYLDLIGTANFRAAFLDGKIVGGLAHIPMGQYFGGRSVPMTGVAAVGVAPEHRGRGVGLALMRHTIGELHEQGVALSTLYPATQVLYRQVGYEQAGGRYEVTLPASQIDVRDRSLEVREIGPDDEALVADLYRRRACRNAGNLDRGPFIWSRVRRYQGEPVRACLFLRDGRAEGYLCYAQGESQNRAMPYDVLVTDVAVLTSAAGRCALSHMADHQSVADAVRFFAWPGDPLLLLLREQRYRIRLTIHWMVRVVHAARALAQRGYPPALQAEVHLRLHDDLLPANDGSLVLAVHDGRGAVAPGGRGTIECDVRGLASLFTGFRSPHDLIATGQLHGPEDQLDTLAAVFAGPTPWMGEMF
jgi:predicted acetyltransferase